MNSSLRYNPAWDGLRAIAALLVIADHSRVPGFAGGYFGVDLFFVLSGFLITRLLVDEFEAKGRIDLGVFYLRRLLRLTPPLLLMLAFYLAFAPSAWPQLSIWEHLRDAAFAAFYLSDYTLVFLHQPRYLLHTWSLAVEEQFYLIWPLAILLLMRIRWRWRVAILVGLYALATTWRIAEHGRVEWNDIYYRLDTRMSGLIMGAIFATCFKRIGPISRQSANITGLLAGLALFVCIGQAYWHIDGGLIWMTAFVKIAAVVLMIASTVPDSWVSTVLSARPLVAVGTISYGLYLWHYSVAAYFRDLLPWQQTFPIVLAVAFAGATASWLLIEKPLRRYRRSLGATQPAAEPPPVACVTVKPC
ncbi:MAG: acyltransferase family protein [Xanthobacteraceae bacterium]|uniref:acyltransferase family protein n=1 Tax=Pseudolabrys sp. TaxID=1960880 RepID=UPI003D13B49E